jgi:hypothetical protein
MFYVVSSKLNSDQKRKLQTQIIKQSYLLSHELHFSFAFHQKTPYHSQRKKLKAILIGADGNIPFPRDR